jgi:23S rRNA pseudouridine1911/1915/1917 synthase
MTDNKTFLAEYAETRLDKFLVERMPSLSRSYLQKLITQGNVSVDGQTTKAPGRRLARGEKVALDLPGFSGLPETEGEKVPILFEDKTVVVADKPAGWVVHPAGPHQTETLIQRLWPKLAAAWATTLQDVPLHTARPGVVHRLDKGTSGVIVIAKTPAAAENLSAQFAARTTEKIYWALVAGAPGADRGTVKSTVGRDRRNPHRMSVTDPGRPAELEFTVLARLAESSLLEVRPKTGRTHQIRVQLAAVGHPLVGDAAYDGPSGPRPLLHASSLSFDHPVTGKRVTFAAPLPEDFKRELKQRGWKK